MASSAIVGTVRKPHDALVSRWLWKPEAAEHDRLIERFVWCPRVPTLLFVGMALTAWNLKTDVRRVAIVQKV